MRQDIQFGGLTLSRNRPYLIAEAGVNHECDLGIARDMVVAAAEAGVDAIKFQSYKSGKLASKFSPSYWDLSKESTTSQFQLFSKYDHFDIKQYEVLAQVASDVGIDFLSTPFDLDFADELACLMPAFKIASADVTNFPLLRRCASKGKPMILSVGAAKIVEIYEAIEVIEAEGCTDICLLHCVLSYPTDPKDANLRGIDFLKETFPRYVTGYSDHVPPSHGGLALTLAWSRGARIIETHYTLDKSKPGNDHYHALDPDDFKAFREQCDYADMLLGEGGKPLLECETESRKQARRSLVINREMKAGEIVREQDLEVKRPGTGIEPRFYEVIVGARAKHDLVEDKVLQWDDFL
ncbi:N-acetylneuraminate synthase family protein [Aestuariispira insulae]|uniref:N-acetylneuraminate synthase n=1 Tax=Aestuariispira insulae TaxID=1461337 RepID=A0A3D9H492_9PROT|nr:N-acetylneuraminate synthase family protein [Aestuariispira insulae]RED44298.1 N-acetylneuraminate synthase [Aestuariispira insulae]